MSKIHKYKNETEKILMLIKLWKEATGRVAVLYPRKKLVSFDGYQVLEVSEAIEMMMRALPEIKLDGTGI